MAYLEQIIVHMAEGGKGKRQTEALSEALSAQILRELAEVPDTEREKTLKTVLASLQEGFLLPMEEDCK